MTESLLKTQAKYIPECSIVRLPDGRTGVLYHRTASKKPHVAVTPDLAVEVNKSTELQLIVPPATLANEYMRRNYGWKK